MKKILLCATAIASLTVSATFMTVSSQPAQAASISNPKCSAGLRQAKSGRKYQAFAMIPGGAHCAWTIHSHSTQNKANKYVVDRCRRANPGKGCKVVWPTY